MNRRFAIIQAVISLVALAAVVWWASRQDAPRLPSTSGEVASLVGALCLYVIATLLRCERWHRILHLTGVDAHRKDSYALTTVGYMGNNVLPARAGEMLKVVLLDRRTESGKRSLLGTVVAERLLDGIVLAFIFVVVAYGALRGATVPSDKPLFVLGVLGAFGVVALIAIQVFRKRGAMVRLREFARPLAGAPRAVLSREGIVLLVGTFLVWAVEASVYLSVAHATSLDISGMGALYLVAFTNLVAMLPAGPGYVGTFDAAVLIAVKALGGAGSAPVSYLLMLRFVLFVPITVVGLAVLVARYGGWSRMRSATRLEATSA